VLLGCEKGQTDNGARQEARTTVISNLLSAPSFVDERNS
jgi:hypothetical protein